MSCATCHLPQKAFADGKSRSTGSQGDRLTRNTPTTLNVGFWGSLFWDGRASSLEQQALAPIQSPREMNQDLGLLERELTAVPGYVKAFHEVFGTGISRQQIARALAAFQRSLVSGPSPLDRYLKGDKSALSESAVRGLELFRGTAGCIRCHHGPLLSDGKFYRLGISRRDRGRQAVTKKPSDAYRFRTPALRDVARTGPYMHDGSLGSLEDVVTFYYRGVPTTAPPGLRWDVEPLLDSSFSEIPDLVEFLKSLNSTLPVISPPRLP